MKKRDTQAQLLKARRDVSGLAKQTRSLVSTTARESYGRLCVLPTDGASNINVWTDAHSIFGEEGVEINLDAPVVGGSARLPGNPNLQVLRAQTQQYVQRVGGKSLVGVDVTLRNLTADDASADGELFTIVSDGSAFAFDRYGYEEPLAPRLRMRTAQNVGQFAYEDYCNTVDQVRDHYARQCAGALAVTGLVVATLNTAFDVGLETPGLESLLALSRDVAVTERGAIDARLASFLPPDLAAHAGAAA